MPVRWPPKAQGASCERLRRISSIGRIATRGLPDAPARMFHAKHPYVQAASLRPIAQRLRLARTSSSATRCRTETDMGSVILSGGAQRRSRRIPRGVSGEAPGCRRAGSFAPASRGLPAPASRAREFDSPLGCRMLALAQDDRGADLPSVGFGSTAGEALAVHFLPQCCVSRRADADEKNATWGNSMQARRRPCRSATLRQKVHIPG